MFQFSDIQYHTILGTALLRKKPLYRFCTQHMLEILEQDLIFKAVMMNFKAVNSKGKDEEEHENESENNAK